MKKIILCCIIVTTISAAMAIGEAQTTGSSTDDTGRQITRERLARVRGDVPGKGTTAALQEKRVASIEQVKGKEVIIKHSNVSKSFLMGDKLHVVVNGESITLEVTFPMQTSSKCRLTSGDAAKLTLIKKGMPVFAGEKAPETNSGGQADEKPVTRRLRGPNN